MDTDTSLYIDETSIADAVCAELREIARRVIGARAARATIEMPGQGVNNRTFIVRASGGEALVVKLRPAASSPLAPSPHWPRYTRQLYGAVPNGDLATLGEVTATLARHGSIRVPRFYLAARSAALGNADYFVSEWLPGAPFDWDANPLGAAATRQLGDHLGRMHGALDGDGFGIYAATRRFSAAEWWPRFGRSFRTILGELARISRFVAALRPRLLAALATASASGAPAHFTLMCVDQSPTHYLAAADGGMAGMVDLEGHLWAPRDYELALVETWTRDTMLLRQAYSRHLEWPDTLPSVRPAYWYYTWLEWIYCLHTLLHDAARARLLELRLGEICAALTPA